MSVFCPPVLRYVSWLNIRQSISQVAFTQEVEESSWSSWRHGDTRAAEEEDVYGHRLQLTGSGKFLFLDTQLHSSRNDGPEHLS
jgi:hypothetical protein